IRTGSSGSGRTTVKVLTSFCGDLVSSVAMPFSLSALGATGGLSGCSGGVKSITRPDDDPMISVSDFVGNN
ncbi:hypothetical protein Tco_0264076, partial [Tanacetum coccineum]